MDTLRLQDSVRVPGDSARICRKVNSNALLSTISSVFHARTFQYVV
jgi:hypothetical protein